jgi:hypothetical protein
MTVNRELLAIPPMGALVVLAYDWAGGADVVPDTEFQVQVQDWQER